MTRPRIVVLALDAARPDLLVQWAREGRLPNFQHLFEQGLSGAIRGIDGYYIGSTWPCFYTGTNTGRHGFHYQSQLIPGTYALRDLASTEPTRETPFWRHLGAAGRRVAILDVPLSKLDPDVNGVQIVEWGVHDDLYGFDAAPQELRRRLAREYGPHLVGGSCDRMEHSPAGYDEFVRRLTVSLEAKTRMTAEIARSEPWDFLIQVFSESHCIGHQCWHLHDPSHPAHGHTAMASAGDPVEQVYRALDSAVGRLLPIARDSTLIVMSAHGMTHWYGAHFLLREILIRLGAASAVETRPVQDSPESPWKLAARRAWHSLPADWRKTLGPLLRRAQANPPPVAPSITTGTQASASKCFAMNNGLGTSGIRLNIAGREPHGTLQAGAEVEEFVRQLTTDLLSLTHVDSSKPAVSRVLRSSEICHGPALAWLPDLVVEWSRVHPVGSRVVGDGRGSVVRIEHPRIGIVEGTNTYVRTGEHEPDGLFVALRPGLRPGRLERTVSIMDFAPTVGALLDVPLDGVDGQVIEELL